MTHPALGWLVCVVVLASCAAPVSDSATPSPTPSPTHQPSSRLGAKDVLAATGKKIGSVDLVQTSDGAIQIDISLDDVAALHPWGIYLQEDCGPPPPDTDAPYQFADIEGGRHQERIEPSAYMEVQGNLMLLVFGADGGTILGCTDLGTGPHATTTDPANPGCEPTGSPAPSVETLAYSRDELSNSDIYLADMDGANERRLTSALGVDMKPTWSPDGRRIAFRSSRDGHDDIFVMNADGTCQVNATSSVEDDRSPAWSPDGCLVAFDHFFDSRFQDIAVMSPAGGALTRITTRSAEYPAWSPDGRLIAFGSARNGNYNIYVINADGTGERRLTSDPAYEFYPAWSPDGDWLAYESGVGSSELEIHVMRPDGSDDQRLTFNRQSDRFPTWSSDGTLIWSHAGTLVASDDLGSTTHRIGHGEFPVVFDPGAATALDCN